MLLGLVVGRLPINFCVREKPTRKIISSCVSSNIFIVCLFTLCEESFEKRGHFRTNLYLTIIYIGVAQKFVMHDITKEITLKANYLRTFKRLSLHENRSFTFTKCIPCSFSWSWVMLRSGKTVIISSNKWQLKFTDVEFELL